MATQRDIRRRITAAKNIKQITRAMQFVAASKLRRAQESTLAARPYSEKIDEVLADVAAVLGGEEHPLLAAPAGTKRLMVLITTDRGLAGPLNTNTIRFIAREITEQQGARMLEPIVEARQALPCVLFHHERWDGAGYPSGLVGTDIPLWGRICAVGDVFDAVTSERPYKPAFPNEDALQLLHEGRGKHFDPRVVDVFFERLDEILAIQQKYKDREAAE